MAVQHESEIPIDEVKNFREYSRNTLLQSHSPDRTVLLKLHGSSDLEIELSDDSLQKHDHRSMAHQIAAVVRIAITARAQAVVNGWNQFHNVNASSPEKSVVQRKIDADLKNLEIDGESESGWVHLRRINQDGTIYVAIDQSEYEQVEDPIELEFEIESCIKSAMDDYIQQRDRIQRRHCGNALEGLNKILKGML